MSTSLPDARFDVVRYRGDYGDDINFAITDSSGAVYDLTGGTVLLKVATSGGGTCKFIGTCTLVTAASGTCKYTTATNDFDTTADYVGELQFSKTGVVLTVADTEKNQPMTIRVKQDRPAS